MYPKGRIVSLSSQSGRIPYFSQGLGGAPLDSSLMLDKLNSLVREDEIQSPTSSSYLLFIKYAQGSTAIF